MWRHQLVKHIAILIDGNKEWKIIWRSNGLKEVQVDQKESLILRYYWGPSRSRGRFNGVHEVPKSGFNGIRDVHNCGLNRVYEIPHGGFNGVHEVLIAGLTGSMKLPHRGFNRFHEILPEHVQILRVRETHQLSLLAIQKERNHAGPPAHRGGSLDCCAMLSIYYITFNTNIRDSFPTCTLCLSLFSPSSLKIPILHKRLKLTSSSHRWRPEEKLGRNNLYEPIRVFQAQLLGLGLSCLTMLTSWAIMIHGVGWSFIQASSNRWSFIQAPHRFFCMRDAVKKIWSDNGNMNFIEWQKYWK